MNISAPGNVPGRKEKKMEAERTYYPINENAAKLSNDMMSFSDYKTGSLTAQYQAAVNEVYQMAENKPDDRREDALYWAGRYAKKYAEYLNSEVEIGTRCPSVMISGGSNFNVRKKEQQVAAWEKNRENLKYCDKIRERIEFIGTHREPITSKSILCEEVACPDCGSYDIYPDTAAGSRKAVKDQTTYENKVDILFKD